MLSYSFQNDHFYKNKHDNILGHDNIPKNKYSDVIRKRNLKFYDYLKV